MRSFVAGSIVRSFRGWEASSQLAFLLCLVLIVPVAVVASRGPEALQEPAAIGVIGLVFAMQAVFLWANRTLVTPFTQAQRAFIRGDFELARDVLEAQRAAGKAEADSLTLLGNTYRQLGDLNKSESILYEALNIRPNHYFPLYGFGRTLLIKGQYAQAVEAIARALANGAPLPVRVDLAEALYRLGDLDGARRQLSELEPQSEPHRELTAVYLRYRLGEGSAPDPDLMRLGLPFWEATAALYRETPYGQALALDIEHLHTRT